MRRIVQLGIGLVMAAVALWVFLTAPTTEPAGEANRVDETIRFAPGAVGDPAPSALPPSQPGVKVKADVPYALLIPALSLSLPVKVLSAESCPVLNPPTLMDAYWVECRSMPGTDSDGTTFIIGHTVAGGQAAFNELPRLAIGDDVQVRTPSGNLSYRVSKTAHYGKYGQVQQSPEVRERVPGRLVLVTCYLAEDGAPTNDNYLVQAELVAGSI